MLQRSEPLLTKEIQSDAVTLSIEADPAVSRDVAGAIKKYIRWRYAMLFSHGVIFLQNMTLEIVNNPGLEGFKYLGYLTHYCLFYNTLDQTVEVIRLHRQVCKGKMTLREMQAIHEPWRAAALNFNALVTSLYWILAFDPKKDAATAAKLSEQIAIHALPLLLGNVQVLTI